MSDCSRTLSLQHSGDNTHLTWGLKSVFFICFTSFYPAHFVMVLFLFPFVLPTFNNWLQHFYFSIFFLICLGYFAPMAHNPLILCQNIFGRTAVLQVILFARLIMWIPADIVRDGWPKLLVKVLLKWLLSYWQRQPVSLACTTMTSSKKYKGREDLKCRKQDQSILKVAAWWGGWSRSTLTSCLIFGGPAGD